MFKRYLRLYNSSDGHDSKPAMCILESIQGSEGTPTFLLFFHLIFSCSKSNIANVAQFAQIIRE